MANRQSECIKVMKSAFSIRLDLLGTFCIKAKGAEEKSTAKGGKLHQGKRCDGKVNGKGWQAASRQKVGEQIRLDFFASFFVKKKRRERKVSGKRWEAASRQKVREKRVLKKNCVAK
jgi:hypothetical protein